MKYSIISRGDPFTEQVVSVLHHRLQKINLKLDPKQPDLVITVGGDGTMLKAVHHYLNQIESCVFVGIHTGKLGFYTDYIHNDLDAFIENIEKNVYTDVSFPLLTAFICNKNDCMELYSLNEMTLINPFHTLHVEVYINDEFFESFQGTGLCISTPSGSSAYNKSLGGALLHPKIQAFQMTEIGSINNNVYRTIGSPMIFPKEHTIKLKSKEFSNFDEVTITVDHMNHSLENYEYIEMKLSEKTVTFRQYNDNDFWKRVQKSFL